MATPASTRGMPWRRVSRWVFIGAGAAIALSLVYFLSIRWYGAWRVEKELRAAQVYLQQRDNRNALLSLKRAVALRPDNLEARRALASLLEEAASSEALIHRRKLMDLEPQLLEPKLAYVRTALRLGHLQQASKTLKAIKGSQRKIPEVMELQAELQLKRGRPDGALEIYRELIELRPEDERTRVKLTALELRSGSERDQETARAALESRVTDDEFGLLALRALADDALERSDFAAALTWSKRACEMPLAEVSDRLLHLEALFGAKSPSFESWLADLERIALENRPFALDVAKWKMNVLGAEAASQWLERLPPSAREDPAICVILADCYSALQRWEDLESLVGKTTWREREPVRLGLLARAQAGLGNVRKSERTWQLAVQEAQTYPAQLPSLLAMARTDHREVRQVLWMIAEREPENLAARQELYQGYWQERNADGMLRMMELVLKERPNDRAAKYNVAALLLVTGRGIDRGALLARELYEDDPVSVGNAAIHGFSLHLKGDSRKAAALLDDRDDLHKLGNDGAAYYSLILAGCGRDDDARRVLSSVDREALLPALRNSVDHTFGAPLNNAVTHQPD
jgi:tetratricopeptide (TPR) repeat protein